MLYYIRESKISQFLEPLQGDQGVPRLLLTEMKGDIVRNLISKKLKSQHDSKICRLHAISGDRLSRYHQVPHFGIYQLDALTSAKEEFSFPPDWELNSLQEILDLFYGISPEWQLLYSGHKPDSTGTLRTISTCILSPDAMEINIASSASVVLNHAKEGELFLLLLDSRKMKVLGEVAPFQEKRLLFVKRYDPRLHEVKLKGLVFVDYDTTVGDVISLFTEEDSIYDSLSRLDVYIEKEEIVKVGMGEQDIMHGSILVYQEVIAEEEENKWTNITQELKLHKERLSSFPGKIFFFKKKQTKRLHSLFFPF